MVAVPALIPVTIPLELTVATAELLVDQVPPAVVLDNVVVAPIHTFVVPVIAATTGTLFTVIVEVADEEEGHEGLPETELTVYVFTPAEVGVATTFAPLVVFKSEEAFHEYVPLPLDAVRFTVCPKQIVDETGDTATGSINPDPEEGTPIT